MRKTFIGGKLKMDKIAFIFSGQGAQHAGMGKEFYDCDEVIRELYKSADEYRPGTLDIMFSGSEEELKVTENTQPGLYLADIAAALYLIKRGVSPSLLAGFSLGEIPALSISGAFSPIEGFKIVCDRGRYMGICAKKKPASMAAVVKLTSDKVEQLCEKYDDLYPVNYNCQTQTVVAGDLQQITLLAGDVKTAGGRVIPLKVGGGFHSPYMTEAAGLFKTALDKYDIKKPSMKVYSNFTGELYGDDVKELMHSQIDHPVRWEKIIRSMADSGVKTFIETGVGNVLTKLIAKIAPECRAYSCETPRQADEIIKEVFTDA